MARGTDDPAAIALLVRQRMRPTNETQLCLHNFPSNVRNISNHVDLEAYSNAELVEQASSPFAAITDDACELPAHCRASEPIPYLADLAALESAKRQENGVKARIVAARFPTIKDHRGFRLLLASATSEGKDA
jgi:hypothetical protein